MSQASPLVGAEVFVQVSAPDALPRLAIAAQLTPDRRGVRVGVFIRDRETSVTLRPDQLAELVAGLTDLLAQVEGE